MSNLIAKAAAFWAHYKKYIIAQGAVLALIPTLAADGTIDKSDIFALLFAEAGALGVRQFANVPLPEAPVRGGDE